jgi:hypothetical protein
MLQCPICKARESENFKVFRDVLDQLIELYPPLAQAEPTWLQLQTPPVTTREAFSWEFGYEGKSGGAGYQWPKGQYPRFDYGEDGEIINVWVPEASVWSDPYEDFTKAQASQDRYLITMCQACADNARVQLDLARWQLHIFHREVCPCCGYFTLGESGSWEICSVCFWEDDGDWRLDVVSGPNHITLRKARANYLEFGACDEHSIGRVRPPLPEEHPQYHQ